MDIFDIIPDNFFSLLSSKNKKLYLACLLQTFKVYETGSILGVDKKIVVDDLQIFLENNSKYFYNLDEEENVDEEDKPQTKRDVAYYVLKRMEDCGWIYIDVTNDYVEILNFSDVAITVCEALLNAYPQLDYSEDYPDDYVNPNEYQGYIYSIYSLLNKKDDVDYSLTFSLVYSETRQLIRSIRRLDVRMKDYIQSVIDNTDIKSLMEKLVNYKNDIYETSYIKLKINDNIDRYRLDIITRLEEYLKDEMILNAVALNYTAVTKTKEDAIRKAVKQIDEVIDAFAALKEFIDELDNKNRNYINSTIGKIKFLLSEEDNVVGKLNRILKYIKDSNKVGKLDKAMTLVDKLHDIPSLKIYDMEKSLYQPRGSYQRNPNQILDESGLTGIELTDDLLGNFKNAYNENEIILFIENNSVDGIFDASRIVNDNCDNKTFMKVVYAIIISVEKRYIINLKDEIIENKTYSIRNFTIRKTL